MIFDIINGIRPPLLQRVNYRLGYFSNDFHHIIHNSTLLLFVTFDIFKNI